MSVKQQFTEEEIYKDRDSQISAIEKTFEDAQKSVNMRYELTVELGVLCCFGCLNGQMADANPHRNLNANVTFVSQLKSEPSLISRSRSTTVNPVSHQWRCCLCSLTSR